jgi:hypothetical protein
MPYPRTKSPSKLAATASFDSAMPPAMSCTVVADALWKKEKTT